MQEGVQDKVREAMMRRHHHQNEKKLSHRIPLVRSFADIGKKHSDPHLLDHNGEAAALWRVFFLRRQEAGIVNRMFFTNEHDWQQDPAPDQ